MICWFDCLCLDVHAEIIAISACFTPLGIDYSVYDLRHSVAI